MIYYSVLVQGENIPMKVDGKECLMGFYLRVFVSAEDTERACQSALAKARSRLDSQETTDSEPSPWIASDLQLSVDEVEAIDLEEVEGDSGFAWYFQDEDSAPDA